jgi:predicted ribosomally synthesized peptide with SipW-like signal peptide
MDKKIMVSMMVIGLVAALAGAGLHALFSDTETSRGNKFTAATLDLKVDGYDDPNVPVYFNISDVKPGDYGYVYITLSNVGSIGGVASLTFANVTDDPGTTPEPEPTPDYGELSGYLYIEVYNRTLVFGGQISPIVTPLAEGNLSALAGSAIELGSLPAGGSITVTIVWSIDSDVGNVIMGDVVTFDMLFSLEQPPA